MYEAISSPDSRTVECSNVLGVVVEDEWLIRMQIVDTLEDAGCEIEEFASGEGAIDFLARSGPVAFLVTDIRLTGPVTGWDVADAYRVANPKIRVIYCSGNPRDEARQVAGSDFMQKPCRMDAILHAALTQ